MANVIEVVVFAADTDTFLTVNDASIAGHCTQWINSTKEQRLKLYTHKMNAATLFFTVTVTYFRCISMSDVTRSSQL